MREKAVVLLSGGIDSAVCLWWAIKRGWEPFALTFNYHRRNPREVESTERLVQESGAEEGKVIEVPFLKEVMDSPISGVEDYKDRIPSSYIPARNTVLYGVATWWAESVNADWIVGGHNRLDFAHYPDSRPQYIEAMNRVIKLGTYIGQRKDLKIVTPLSDLSKVEVLRMAIDLEVPLHLTWSCHGRGEKACGHCEACGVRKDTFHMLGMEDPVEYE